MFKKIAAGVLSLMLVLSGTVFQVPAYAEPQTDGVEISESTFPDTAFRKYVTENFDTDQNLILSQDEINKATNIFIRMKGVQTLKGIEYFTNLQYLDAELNQIQTVDLSKNTKLEDVDLSNNTLTSLQLPNDSRNDTLRKLNVFSNRLQELDVRNLFALKELVADDNSLKTLDLTDNPLDDGYGFTALNNYLESVTLPDSGMQYSWKKYLMTQEFPRGKETGYKHQWYTDAAKQNPIDPETTETIQFNGQTLYAEYLPIRYTVEFNAGTEEVTGSMESLVLQYGDSVQLPEIAFRPVNDEVEFAGWQSSKGKTYGNRQTISNLTDKDGEVIRFTAKWKDKNFDGQPYQIVLKDGASTETQEGKYGESYELQSVSFAKDHYHLAGWALSEGGPKAFSVNASLLFSKPSEIGGGTLTLYAVWEKDVYRVEFEDTPSHISPVTVAYDETVALPDPGEKTGYTFEGWYTQRIGGEQWQADDRVSGPLTLYARFEPIRYRVEFDGNGAGNPEAMESSGMELAYDETAQLPENRFEKKYHTFKGWSLRKDGASYYPDQAQISSLISEEGETVTLYAVWERNQVHIEASADGKTTKFSMYQGDLLSLAVPVKQGYIFEGWLAGGTEIFWNMNDPVIDDLNLVAVFAPVSYHIVFDGNGADNPDAMKDASLDMVYDRGEALPENLYERAYHTFAGWSTEKNGEAEYHDKAEVLNLTASAGETVRLYAVWKRETASVVLDSGLGEPQELQAGLGLPLPESTQLSRAGYRFGGWYTSRDFAPESAFTPDMPVTGPLTLYAKWSLETYTITFADGENDPISYTIEDTVRLPEPSRKGYEFVGWRDETGTPVPQSFEGRYGDLRLTAVWKKLGTSQPAGGNDSDVPQTGETNRAAPWLALTLLSAGGALGAGAARIRRKKA